MFDIRDVKTRGREAFKKNFWRCVLVAFLMSLLTGGSTTASRSQQAQNPITFASQEEMVAFMVVFFTAFALFMAIVLALKIFIANPLEVGGSHFFQKNVEASPVPVGTMKVGFANYGHTFITMFLRDLFILLWCLLLIVPGIIKAISYSMVPYILAENPELPAREVLRRSEQMMEGNKAQAFKMALSFLGWILFGIVTFGIGFFLWTLPYIDSSYAALYVELKGQQARKEGQQ